MSCHNSLTPRNFDDDNDVADDEGDGDGDDDGDDGAENFFENLDRVDAVDSVRFSSKSELSSRVFGRLKFLAVFADCALWCQQKPKNKKRNFSEN